MHSRATLCCDGCGMIADAQHIRERIIRLEWATRFRPIHMHTLLLFDAPPAGLADFVYDATRAAGRGDAWGDRFFAAILAAAGVRWAPGANAETQLAALAHTGLYVNYVCECPSAESGELLADRFAATLARRIHFSYKPQIVVPVTSAAARALAAQRPAPGSVRVCVPATPLSLPADAAAGWEEFTGELRAAILRSS